MGAAFPPVRRAHLASPAAVPRPAAEAREPAIASRRRTTAPAGATAGEVGPRQPCPCGSGRRYKSCHGAGEKAAVPLERRPFAGLPGEVEWVALREIVPAATFGVRLAGADGRAVTVATVLPMNWPALTRADGAVFLGLQAPARSGDLSRELAAVLTEALAAAPGTSVAPSGLPAPGPRLQDLLADDPVRVEMHDGFDFWLDGVGEVDDEVRASLERANSAVVPTVRLAGVEAAYWCRMPHRNHLRWVLPYEEESALDGLARLFAGDGLTLGGLARYVGSFRAHGLLVPVWDLPSGAGADDLEEPVAALAGRLAEAVGAPAPLTDIEQRARRALAGRQVTIR